MSCAKLCNGQLNKTNGKRVCNVVFVRETYPKTGKYK